MTESFKVGISGAGTIGRVHAEAIAGLERATVVAVAEPREDAGRAFERDFGGTWYPDFDAMLANADIDTVIIATPSGIHPAQVVRAAKAGKNIITEKPMAITPDGLSQMLDACEQAGVILAVIFQNRFSPDVLKVRRAIAAGLLGTPVLANGAVYWHRTDDYYKANGGWRGTWELDGGGALMNQAIHTVDLLQWLMGGVDSIQAHTTTLTHSIETEDIASASFRFANGALGGITATTSADKDYPVRVEIVGTKGRVTLERNATTLWEGESPLDDSLLTEEDRALTAGWEPGEPFVLTHQRQLRSIFDAMAAGTQPPVPGEEARAAVDIILGIYESNRTGARVRLEDVSE